MQLKYPPCLLFSLLFMATVVQAQENIKPSWLVNPQAGLNGGIAVVTDIERDKDGSLYAVGGFTNTAFLKGAYITRVNKSELLKDTNSVYAKRLLQQSKDSSGLKTTDVFLKTIKIGINVNDIVANENSLENIYLQE